MPSYAVIGASRGIGYQFLKTLSQDPSNVIIGTARTVGPTQEKVIADALPNVHIIQADLDDAPSLHSAASETSKITGGVIDHLIVNGAYLASHLQAVEPSDFADKEAIFLEEVNKCMKANVAGTLFAINAFLPLVKKSSAKKVIAITSGMADPDAVIKCGLSGGLPYAISKAGVNILAGYFASEARASDSGIKYLALSPGFVATSAAEARALNPEPPTPEEQAAMTKIVEGFKKYEPTFKGPISPQESVDSMMQVIANLTDEQSGAFLSHHGNRRWL